MNKKIKKELKKSFTPPKLDSNIKREFLNSLDYDKSRDYEVFFVQISYIRKRVWLLSVMIVILAFYVLNVYEDSYSKTVALSSVLPLLSLLSIGEICKTMSFNMHELEMSCKYNLQKITLIQMAVIGTLHFILMLALLLVCNNSTKIGFGVTVIYGITPYLVVNYISLFVINKIKSRENLYLCYGVVFFVSIMVFNLAKSDWLYRGNMVYKLSLALIVLTILFVREFIILIKEREDIACHSKLTV